MTNTNTAIGAAAPEALRLADAIDPFERKSAPDHLTSKVAADELRRLHAENERLAALVEAQQPTTHVQNPAEIEHVAGDVSKNGAESHMAQQAAPSVASKAVLAAIRAANMQLVRTGDDEFMLVTYKNAKAQCDGGKCGIGGYCDDCPTPQADSQPAQTYSIDADTQGIRARVADAITGALAFGAQGAQPPPTGHWLAPFWEMAREEAIRAARAPADSVTAPAGGVDDAVDAIALARYKVVPAHESMFHRFAVVAGDGKRQLYLGRETECANMARKFAGAFLDGAFYQANIAPTPPAQAADSVLEDAARESEYRRGYRHGYEQRDAEVRGALA